jgi:DNA-binding transcriptional MerR regulator
LTVAEYRIDDLARAAGMTTRNVRAYQDRGLLPAPRRAGRVALYGDAHLARLKLIGSMLGRGYTTAHIAEMLSAWEHGKDLADVLGVEQALVKPWGADQPTAMAVAEVRELAGDQAAFDWLVRLGIVSVHGSTATVTRPKLLESFAETRGYGLAMETVLDLHERVQAPIDAIARQLVRATAQHFAAVKGPDWVPEADELGELITRLGRFRQLAMSSVADTLATSIEQAMGEVLGDYVAHLAG